MTTPTDPTAALKLARDDLQSPISRGPTWALIERYADAVCEYNTAVRIDVGIDKAGAECLSAEKELRAHLAALAAIDALPAPSGEPAAKPAPLNGIKATMFHDEGAIAQCGNCKRYTLDPKALADSRQPVCDCGRQHYWSGSFKKPGPDAQWFGAAPQAAPAPQASALSGEPAEPTRADLIAALTFYAHGGHMNLSDQSAWDTVSGEPPNWWCDEAGTATIEDGSLAKMALSGDMNAGHFAALERGDDVCIEPGAGSTTPQAAPAPLPRQPLTGWELSRVIADAGSPELSSVSGTAVLNLIRAVERAHGITTNPSKEPGHE